MYEEIKKPNQPNKQTKKQCDIVDYTPAGLVGFFFPANRCVRKKKKEEIKESDADLAGGDCDVAGEISDPKHDVSLAAR